MNSNNLNDSILLTIKKMLGISPLDDSFDDQLIVHINTAISILYQLGISEDDNFAISGITETWGDMVPTNFNKLSMLRNFVFYKVKLAFDPPQSSFVLDSYKTLADEVEHRLIMAKEYDS